MVEYGVGLEQVEHPQLAGTQRSREVACTPYHNHLSTFNSSSEFVEEICVVDPHHFDSIRLITLVQIRILIFI